MRMLVCTLLVLVTSCRKSQNIHIDNGQYRIAMVCLNGHYEYLYSIDGIFDTHRKKPRFICDKYVMDTIKIK